MIADRPQHNRTDLKKVAVIGGTGFIGHHIVNDLVQQGCAVTIFTRNIPTKKPAEWKNVVFMKLDAQKASVDEFKMALTEHQGLVYAAGGDPGDKEFREKNVDTVQRIMTGARQAGCDRAVILGSYYTYFACDKECKFGNDLRQKHTYVASRIEQAESARKIGGDAISVAVIEIPWVFGVTPGRTSLWKALIDWANSWKPLFAPNGGTATVSVETVARVTVAALQKRSDKNIPVAEGNFTWNQLFNKMTRTARSIHHLPTGLMKAAGAIYGTFATIAGLSPRHFLGEIFTKDLFIDLKKCRAEEKELGIVRTEKEVSERMDAAFMATIDSCRPNEKHLPEQNAFVSTDRAVLVNLNATQTVTTEMKAAPPADPYVKFQEKYKTLEKLDEKIAALQTYQLLHPDTPHSIEINAMLMSLQAQNTIPASPNLIVDATDRESILRMSLS